MDSNRNVRRGGGLIGLLAERIQFDWFASIALTVLLTLMVLFSLVAGVTASWAVLFGSGLSATLDVFFKTARTAWWVVLGVDLLISLAVMFFLSREKFSFIRGLMVNLLVGWIIFLFFTLGHTEVLSSFGSTGTDILWFCLCTVFSYVLSVLPAIIAAGIAKIVHIVLDALL